MEKPVPGTGKGAPCMRNTASFFARVYRLAALIPPGKVATYGQLAWMLSCPFGARAVGQAMARAPGGGLVPCHRVVNARGGLAPGLAFGGPDVQRGRLLEEGVPFLPDGRVDLEKCLWRPQAELG